jgi:hypothetical protein
VQCLHLLGRAASKDATSALTSSLTRWRCINGSRIKSRGSDNGVIAAIGIAIEVQNS